MEEKKEELKNVEINDEELENVSGGVFDDDDLNKVNIYISKLSNPIARERAYELFFQCEVDKDYHTYNQFVEEFQKRCKDLQ